MRNLFISAITALCFVWLACTPKTGTGAQATDTAHPNEPTKWDAMGKPLVGVDSSSSEEPVEYEFQNELNIVAPKADNLDSLRPYNASHSFEHDLIHTKIEISFDWTKKRANATATLTLRPWFYDSDKLHLDAKNFDIHSVTFEGKNEPLKYTYNNEELVIDLGRKYTRTETYKVTIRYTAKPDERESFGGSAAITSDKGLYFINPDGSDNEKPKQIWTQGETESNSFWFPTIDKPNERCTQEMYITVEDKYKTLSNGLLISSKKNSDGTRTDYWKMDKPHAPYLFMMAIGEYAVVKDKWRGIDVDYYVEPKYEAAARDIFPNTPELLEFYSQILGYDYAWPKFSQVIVRDYVSGAMENTTAVIFGEYMQGTKRDLMETHYTNEKVVAHEMFHHWFGDLVTTENWANLTLNEGFANYSEYLWMEHKHGKDAADEHLAQEQSGYLYSASDGGHPLIHYGYGNREDMFDAHSYNKGGSILHMLRNLVGDDAFFASLSRYLKRNEFTDVEVDELRMAFEETTGQDLHWFFDQWFIGAGHPILNIGHEWDESNKQYLLTIEQTQTGKDVARVFKVPMAIDIYEGGAKRRENVVLTQRKQKFVFPCKTEPNWVNVDADKTLLCQKEEALSPVVNAFKYRNGPLYRDRDEALDALSADAENPLTQAVLAEALQDKFHGLRLKAMSAANVGDTKVLDVLAKLAETETEPANLGTAIQLLGQSGDKKYVPLISKYLGEEQSYSVVNAAFSALNQLDPDAAAAASVKLEKDEHFLGTVAELYAAKPSADKMAFFDQNVAKADNMQAFAFFDNYAKFLIGLNNNEATDAAIEKLKSYALDATKNSEWRRFASTKCIADLRNDFREKNNGPKVEALQSIIEAIKSKETDPTLKMYYDMF